MMLVIIRGPSASSTTAAVYGTRWLKGGRSLRYTTDQVYSAASPDACSHSTASLQQCGQNPRG
jgi:hypothetical protein